MSALGAWAGGCPWLLGAQPGGHRGRHQDTHKAEDRDPRSRHPPGLGSCLPSLGTGQLWEAGLSRGQHGPRRQTAGFPALPQKALTCTCCSPPPSVPGHMVPAPQAGTISAFLGKRPKDPRPGWASPAGHAALCDGDPSTGAKVLPPGRAAVPHPGTQATLTSGPTHPLRAWRAARSPPARAQAGPRSRAEACQPPGACSTHCPAGQGRSGRSSL